MPRRRGAEHWREKARAGGCRDVSRGRRRSRRAAGRNPRIRAGGALESRRRADRPTPATRLALRAGTTTRLMERAEGRRARTLEKAKKKRTPPGRTSRARRRRRDGRRSRTATCSRVRTECRCAPLPIAPPPIVGTDGSGRTAAITTRRAATETAGRVAAAPTPRPTGSAADDAAREPRFGRRRRETRVRRGKTKAPTAGCSAPETSAGGDRGGTRRVAEASSLRRRARSRASSRRAAAPPVSEARGGGSTRRGARRRGRPGTFANLPGTSPSFRVRRRRNPNPSRWSICGAPPAAKPREPWGPPPRAPEDQVEAEQPGPRRGGGEEGDHQGEGGKGARRAANLTRQTPSRRIATRRRRRARRKRLRALDSVGPGEGDREGEEAELCVQERVISRQTRGRDSVQEGQSRGEGETEGTRTRTSRRGTVMTEAWCAERVHGARCGRKTPLAMNARAQHNTFVAVARFVRSFVVRRSLAAGRVRHRGGVRRAGGGLADHGLPVLGLLPVRGGCSGVGRRGLRRAGRRRRGSAPTGGRRTPVSGRTGSSTRRGRRRARSGT